MREDTKIIKKAILVGPEIYYGIFLSWSISCQISPLIDTYTGFSKNVFVLSLYAAIQAEGRYVHNWPNASKNELAQLEFS